MRVDLFAVTVQLVVGVNDRGTKFDATPGFNTECVDGFCTSWGAGNTRPDICPVGAVADGPYCTAGDEIFDAKPGGGWGCLL